MSNRAFNELRVTYGVNKPWILANIAGGLGGRNCWRPPATRRRSATRPASSRASRYPGASFGATSFTGLEGEGNLFVVDNFSFIRGRHQFKFGGVVARQQMYMDVEAAHVGIWSFTQDRKFDVNDPSSYPVVVQRQHRQRRREPGGLESVAVRAGHVAGDRRSDVQPRRALRSRPHPDLGRIRYVDRYNQRIVARLGGAPPLGQSVADKNNVSPRLGVVWVPTADRQTTLRSSFGFYYDQNHWNFTDIYLNETLLALRRITLNANTQGGNPFWTPANTAIGIAQMRAFLAKSFPAYPDMSGLPFPQETILGVQPNYKIPYSANFAVGMTHDFGQRLTARADYVHTRTYDANTGPTRTGRRTPTARSRAGIRATPTSRWSATADRSGTTASSRGSSTGRRRARAPGCPTRCRRRAPTPRPG